MMGNCQSSSSLVHPLRVEQGFKDCVATGNEMRLWNKCGEMIDLEPLGGGICARRAHNPAGKPEIRPSRGAAIPVAMSDCSRHPRLIWKARAVFSSILWIALVGLSPAQIASAPSSRSSDAFSVSGTVVNSVTGEPIGRALVRVSGGVRTAFTDAEGHFQIEGVQEGSFVEAQKPGYFSPQDSDGSGRNKPGKAGSEAGSTLLKLTPLSAVYGRVTDGAGQPIERIPLRIVQRAVRDGRQRWDPLGSALSDEDGWFRFANLMPGVYYLAAGPGRDEIRILAVDERPKTGYPMVYYPGASDLASASPIQLVPGQQTEADFSIAAVPVYQISGTMTGYRPDQSYGLLVLNQLGDPMSTPARLHLDTGAFDIEALPAGSYVLKAMPPPGDQPLRAELPLNVTSNFDNVHLVLGPAISIPVMVHAESRTSNSTVGGWDSTVPPPVSVRVTRLEPSASSAQMILEHGNRNNPTLELRNLDPGKYVVDLMPHSRWYVQSAVYGETNLLSDDLTVAPGQNYPMEIVLRDDGATLTGNVKSSDGTEAQATVLLVPQSTSRRSTKVGRSFPPNGFTLNALPPGEHLVFAFDHADKIEYANADALQPYASQAAHVTLTPNQETHVVLNLIHTGGGE